MSAPFGQLDTLAVNTIRTLSIDIVQKAASGHPGLPLGAAPVACVLWQRHLKHDPLHPEWPDRDRFILSAGHGSALVYSLLFLTGYDVSMDDLKSFRQWNSKTPGHPESFMTPGVETTTGPLGQGAANAVGMAIAERFLANRYNRDGQAIVDHYTYALVSDGDLMEGICAEASSLAGHLKLGKLIFLYDSNDISLNGPTSLTFSGENVLKRYEAYGWQTIRVDNGNDDLAAIDAAIAAARADTSRPSIIEIKTTIGYGSPNKQGSSKAHGSPLGEDEVVLTKKHLGWKWPNETFHVPDDALAHMRAAIDRGEKSRALWLEKFESWARQYPDLAREWSLALEGKLPDAWDRDLPSWKAGEKIATRVASGQVLNAISGRVGWLIGCDADLSSSTNAEIKGSGAFNGATGEGRNICCGVREHAMAGIANGIAWHGGCRPFTSTFFVFSDYMRPSVRLAAMSGLPIIYVWTHDSIFVGEDGPTHQPIEHLSSLRSIPNLAVVRPADAAETLEAWRWAMETSDRPIALVLTRQNLPVLDRSLFGDPSGLRRGAYVISDPQNAKPQAIVISTGSEVHVAIDAQKLLAADGIHIRVVSMPCWELFEEQTEEYRESVLPSDIKARVSIEAGTTMGWARWVGDSGLAIGIDHFGASAPGNVLARQFGFTPEKVADSVRRLLSHK